MLIKYLHWCEWLEKTRAKENQRGTEFMLKKSHKNFDHIEIDKYQSPRDA